MDNISEQSLPSPPLPEHYEEVVYKPKKKRRWPWVILGISLLLNMATCTSALFNSVSYPEEEYPLVNERLAWGEAHGTKVALLRLSGAIFPESPSTLFGAQVDPVTKLLSEIQAVTMDEEVRAILIEIDSPGGTVTGSDQIYRALLQFKESSPDRIIVARVGSMAASGGYYVAMAADHIVAEPTSMVGSVGVILSAMNFHELGKKIGVDDVSLTSGENKALLSPFDPPNQGHQKILQDIVDELYRQFRAIVIEGRDLDEAYVNEHQLLDGRLITAQEALEHGLVDEIGLAQDARASVERLLKTDQVAFTLTDYTGGWGSLFAVRSPELGLPQAMPKGFLYYWSPAL